MPGKHNVFDEVLLSCRIRLLIFSSIAIFDELVLVSGSLLFHNRRDHQVIRSLVVCLTTFPVALVLITLVYRIISPLLRYDDSPTFIRDLTWLYLTSNALGLFSYLLFFFTLTVVFVYVPPPVALLSVFVTILSVCYLMSCAYSLKLWYRLHTPHQCCGHFLFVLAELFTFRFLWRHPILICAQGMIFDTTSHSITQISASFLSQSNMTHDIKNDHYGNTKDQSGYSLLRGNPSSHSNNKNLQNDDHSSNATGTADCSSSSIHCIDYCRSLGIINFCKVPSNMMYDCLSRTAENTLALSRGCHQNICVTVISHELQRTQDYLMQFPFFRSLFKFVSRYFSSLLLLLNSLATFAFGAYEAAHFEFGFQSASNVGICIMSLVCFLSGLCHLYLIRKHRNSSKGVHRKSIRRWTVWIITCKVVLFAIKITLIWRARRRRRSSKNNNSHSNGSGGGITSSLLWTVLSVLSAATLSVLAYTLDVSGRLETFKVSKSTSPASNDQNSSMNQPKNNSEDQSKEWLMIDEKRDTDLNSALTWSSGSMLSVNSSQSQKSRSLGSAAVRDNDSVGRVRPFTADILAAVSPKSLRVSEMVTGSFALNTTNQADFNVVSLSKSSMVLVRSLKSNGLFQFSVLGVGLIENFTHVSLIVFACLLSPHTDAAVFYAVFWSQFWWLICAKAYSFTLKSFLLYVHDSLTLDNQSIVTERRTHKADELFEQSLRLCLLTAMVSGISVFTGMIGIMIVDRENGGGNAALIGICLVMPLLICLLCSLGLWSVIRIY